MTDSSNSQFITGGLNFDNHYTLRDTNSVYYIRNGDIADYSNGFQVSYVQNALSNELCVDLEGKKLVGHSMFDRNRSVLFLKDDYNSYIYLFDSNLCTLNLITSGPCLNFSSEHYVTGVYKNDTIYFTDGYNPPRYIDTTNVPRKSFNECDSCNDSPSEELDCNKIKFWKCSDIPEIKVEVTDGNIPAGVYQVAIAFCDQGDVYSDWFIYSERMNLHGKFGREERFGFRVEVGCVTTHKQFKIALIAHREDRGTVAQDIGTFENTQKYITITELDSTFYHPISNEQLYLTNINYLTARHIATNGDHLIMGGLTERAMFDYQPIANQIESYVDIVKVPGPEAYKYPTYMSGEVYPFYIQWMYCDGQATKWYHIPSNVEPQPEYFQQVTNKDAWVDKCETATNQYWEVYDTSTILSLLEPNDNGLHEATVVPDYTNCKTYKVETESGYWYGTLRYKPCDSTVFVEEYGQLRDFRFCTDDIASATLQVQAFDVENEVVSAGLCNSAQSNLAGTPTCNRYRLSYQYYADTEPNENKGNLTYEPCIYDDLLNFETCDPNPITYSGDLTDHFFCTCNPESVSLTPFDWDFVEIDRACYGITTGGEDAYLNPECEGVVIGTSTFSYWESAIKYPKGFTSLKYVNDSCKQGIKYHKFPDRTSKIIIDGIIHTFPHIHSNAANANAKEYVYILAPRFENIQRPKDCHGNDIPDIIGYRIGYGSRDNHKSIIHKGMLYNMREELLEDCITKSYFPNYPFNDLNPDVFIGDTELLRDHVQTDIGAALADIFGNPDGNFTPMDDYSKKHFQYISPDIQNEINDYAATELLTYRMENGFLNGEFNSTREFPDMVILNDWMYFAIGLVTVIAVGANVSFVGTSISIGDPLNFMNSAIDTIKKFSTGKNYATNSVGYSNYTRSGVSEIIPDNRRRKIETRFFMQPSKQKYNNIYVNNYQRESGLFLELNNDILDPIDPELSRITMKMVDDKVYRDVYQNDYKTRSYYVGLKRKMPNQYGDVMDSTVIAITDLKKTESSGHIISGDIYITKHTYFRKFPFFTDLPLEAQRNSPVMTSQFLNVGYPKYWLDNNETNDIWNVIRSMPFLNSSTFVFGNVHNRYLEFENLSEKSSCKKKRKRFSIKINPIALGQFYTHLGGISHYYCESEYIGEYRGFDEVPMSRYYPMNPTQEYHKYKYVQYPEVFIYDQQQRFKGVQSKYDQAGVVDCCDKNTIAKDRVIFSVKNDVLSKADRWTKFLPNNYHQFFQQDGELTAIHAIDDSNILFLFDNAAYLSQTGDGILTTTGVAYLGVGSIFERRIRKISSEINGFGGCIDKYSFVNTPYGAFWADRNRKAFVGTDGKGVADLTTGMHSWFNEFLDEEIIGHYDPYTRNIYWSTKSWTISYKPETKSFISFHDFLPQRYIADNYNFSTVDTKGIWKHNRKNHYQTYYGKTYPFDVGFILSNKLQQTIPQSLEVNSEFYTNQGFGKRLYHESKFFDRFLLYNNYCTTGIQNLVVQNDKNELSQLLNRQNNNINVSNVEHDSYRLNNYLNTAQYGSNIEWIKDKYVVTNSFINKVEGQNGTIRGKYFNTHFVADHDPEIKKTIQLTISINDKVDV